MGGAVVRVKPAIIGQPPRHFAGIIPCMIAKTIRS
jgi:hypothetical protein